MWYEIIDIVYQTSKFVYMSKNYHLTWLFFIIVEMDSTPSKTPSTNSAKEPKTPTSHFNFLFRCVFFLIYLIDTKDDENWQPQPLIAKSHHHIFSATCLNSLCFSCQFWRPEKLSIMLHSNETKNLSRKQWNFL